MACIMRVPVEGSSRMPAHFFEHKVYIVKHYKTTKIILKQPSSIFSTFISFQPALCSFHFVNSHNECIDNSKKLGKEFFFGYQLAYELLHLKHNII